MIEIMKTERGFVVAEDGTWIPGTYPTPELAREAADMSPSFVQWATTDQQLLHRIEHALDSGVDGLFVRRLHRGFEAYSSRQIGRGSTLREALSELLDNLGE